MIDKTINKVKSKGCIVIQDRIVEDINLNSTDKLVYGIIKALSNNKGYCFATNDYIGKRAGLSKSTISNTIRKLKKYDYIRAETIDYQRRIYVEDDANKLSGVY